MRGVAVDSVGSLYIADTYNNVIRKISASTGTVSTIAGSSNVYGGFGGDGSAAVDALLQSPFDVLVDSNGNLFILDNNVVRKVSHTSNIITTIAGFFDLGGYSGDGCSATAATFNNPRGFAIDSVGNIFLADTFNNVIRQVIAQSNIVVTIGGSSKGQRGYSGDGAAATNAYFNGPRGIAVDSIGNIFVADSGNNAIRIMKASGSSASSSITSPGIPTVRPTKRPSPAPSKRPTNIPSVRPTVRPSKLPSPAPSKRPNLISSVRPTVRPSQKRSPAPSKRPTCATVSPKNQPSPHPTKFPNSHNNIGKTLPDLSNNISDVVGNETYVFNPRDSTASISIDSVIAIIFCSILSIAIFTFMLVTYIRRSFKPVVPVTENDSDNQTEF